MAEITIRPVSDDYVYSLTYSSGTQAFPLLNEEIADGLTTYVGLSSNNSTLKVKCSYPDVASIDSITAITVYANMSSGVMNSYALNFNIGLSAPVSNIKTISIPPDGIFYEYSHRISVNLSPSDFDLANLTLYFILPYIPDTKHGVLLTQVYAVIEYIEKPLMPFTIKTKVGGTWRDVADTSPLYVKIGGVWRSASALYVKIGGVWRSD